MNTTQNEQYDLTTPILNLTSADTLTMRDLCSNILVLGAIGAGKSTATGNSLLGQLFSHGLGGFIGCAKASEYKNIEALAAKHGRLDDLIRIHPDEKWRFDFLAYQYKKLTALHGVGSGLGENLVNIIDTVTEVGRGSESSSSDSFWKDAGHLLSLNCIDLCSIALNRVSIPDITKIINSIAQSVAETADPTWQANSYCFKLLNMAENKQDKTPTQKKDFPIVAEYFLQEMPRLDSKTRSNIISGIMSTLGYFNRGVLRDLFCSGETNFIPEFSYLNQKIIVCDLSTKSFQKIGVFANVLMKFMWQKSIETRNLQENSTPAFCYCDEAWAVCNQYDIDFAAASRSLNVGICYLSQNIAGFRSALGGGEKGRSLATVLLASLKLKVFHALDDEESRKFFSGIIGQTFQARMGMSANGSSNSTGFHSHEQLVDSVLGRELMLLRSGGEENDFIVDSYITQAGRKWKSEEFQGKTYIKRAWQQEFV